MLVHKKNPVGYTFFLKMHPLLEAVEKNTGIGDNKTTKSTIILQRSIRIIPRPSPMSFFFQQSTT
jgi:hypothetical protein